MMCGIGLRSLGTTRFLVLEWFKGMGGGIGTVGRIVAVGFAVTSNAITFEYMHKEKAIKGDRSKSLND